MNQLEINLKAAKMLGYDAYVAYDPLLEVDCVYRSIRAPFDLFIFPSDTLAVVKMLGEKHGISVIYSETNRAWGVTDTNDLVICRFALNPYEAAVGAAIEAI